MINDDNKLILLCKFLLNEAIDWHFISRKAPSGGESLQELCVKSVKYHLCPLVYNVKLTYEEFWAVIVQIVGILNSFFVFNFNQLI